MAKTYRCAACGEGVEGYAVEVGAFTEVRCLLCGLPLEKRAEGGKGRFRRVLLADDSAFFTQALETFLSEKRLAGEVLKAADGAEAVERATVALRERRPVTLAVIDLLMPRLNGLQCAIALRAVERAFGPARAAVLFLSSRRIDESLRPVLDELQPAYYLNKGTTGEPLLGERLETVLRAIAAATLLPA